MRKIHCKKIRLNRDGYTARGTYFGVGKPVYLIEYWFEKGDTVWRNADHVRAWSRSDALAAWHCENPNMRHHLKGAIGKL